MPTDPLFYVCAVPAVLLLGLSKGGFAGLGALGTPLMAIGVGDPVEAAAILLPILVAQDVVGVAAFRREWDRHIVAVMLPGAVLGILLAALFAAFVPERAVMALLGLITILFGAYRLWVEARHRAVEARSSSASVGALFGMLSGFTSQIAHAGGPPFQMWVLPRRLPHTVFVGTTAIFFAAVNLLKVPAYLALGQFTRETLLTALVLLPVAVLGSLAGVWLVRRVTAKRFYTIVYLLMIVTGGKLVADALTG